jgi:hypothetical protein
MHRPMQHVRWQKCLLAAAFHDVDKCAARFFTLSAKR